MYDIENQNNQAWDSQLFVTSDNIYKPAKNLGLDVISLPLYCKFFNEE